MNGHTVVTIGDPGQTVSFWVERAMLRIMQVSDDAPQPIRDQARAFQGRVRFVVQYYMMEAAKSYETDVKVFLEQAGHPELAASLPGPRA